MAFEIRNLLALGGVDHKCRNMCRCFLKETADFARIHAIGVSAVADVCVGHLAEVVANAFYNVADMISPDVYSFIAFNNYLSGRKPQGAEF